MNAATSKRVEPSPIARPDEMGVAWDEPPPYELHSSGAILASSCTLKGIKSHFLPREFPTDSVT